MKIINVILILSTLIVGLILYPQFPAQMPMHWNALGQIDGYMPKNAALLFMPILMILMYTSFQIFPNFDPKKDKYKLFRPEWEIMQTGLIGFFTYVHFMILYLSLNPGVAMMPLMFIGLGVLFILMGNYMSKIRQNYFIGIKVPWTLASEDNWNKTHRFASWCFVTAGILTLIEAYFIWYAPFVIFGSIMLSTCLPMIYSFLLYKNAADKMKYVYAGILVIILGLAALRMFAGEDDWICVRTPAADGSVEARWVKHGAPSAPMPTTPCR